jgi:hypothetical protein
LYQFNVTIPDLADGDHAVTAEVGGVRTGKIGRIRVQRQMSAGIARPLPHADGQILARLLKVHVS